MTDQAADAPQRVCPWCKTMAPERFSEAEVITTPLPSVHHVHELCRVCGDNYDTRLRILRPDIVEAQESQRAEAVRRDKEELQRIIGDRILANRARPANGGTMRSTDQNFYTPLWQQGRAGKPPDGAHTIRIRLNREKSARRPQQGTAAHTRDCRDPAHRARYARAHEQQGGRQ